MDFAFLIGVLHPIPEPLSTVKKVFECLRPGGKSLILVYGYEGNEIYLSILLPLLKVTSTLPDFLLDIIANVLIYFVGIYMGFCRAIELP